MWPYMYLFAGLILLIVGADWLLAGAASLAKRFKVHKLVIGMTIVAFGTSLPELFVTLIASSSGNSAVLMGNIIGSCIANILLILGITAVITKLPLHRNTIWKDIPFSFVSIGVMLLLAKKLFLGRGDAILNLSDGIIMLMLFGLFLYYTSDGIIKKRMESEETKEEIELAEPKKGNLWLVTFTILLGLLSLYIGGKMTVENSVIVARFLGVSEFFISVTLIAVGTSLPELFVSVRAAFKRELDLAIGNVIGSNIFNILFIVGIGALINPIIFSASIIVDILILMTVTALLFGFMFVGDKHTLNRFQGAVFVAIYICYILFSLLR